VIRISQNLGASRKDQLSDSSKGPGPSTSAKLLLQKKEMTQSE
jgi:hypothetical protein